MLRELCNNATWTVIHKILSFCLSTLQQCLEQEGPYSVIIANNESRCSIDADT